METERWKKRDAPPEKRMDSPERNTISSSSLRARASTVARGTIKPHDRRYRNRLPWLSYVICFTSRPACERGQTSGQIEKRSTPPHARILYDRLSTPPARWQSKLDRREVLNRDRLRGREERRKRRKKKKKHELPGESSCSFAGLVLNNSSGCRCFWNGGWWGGVGLLLV